MGNCYVFVPLFGNLTSRETKATRTMKFLKQEFGEFGLIVGHLFPLLNVYTRD